MRFEWRVFRDSWQRSSRAEYEPLPTAVDEHEKTGCESQESLPPCDEQTIPSSPLHSPFQFPLLLKSYYIKSKSRQDEPTVKPTAWLDGLRGLTSWFVVNTHMMPILCKWAGTAWAYDGENARFLQLPVVSVLYNGYFAVSIFFIISGYALSLRPVSAMQRPTETQQTVVRTSFSAALRRPFRLLVPAWMSTLLPFIAIITTVLAAAQALEDTSLVLDGRMEQFTSLPPRMSSFWDQLIDLLAENVHLLRISDMTNARSKYNLVLWTIAVELRGSLILYAMHAALSLVKKVWFRLLICFGLTIAFFILQMSEMPLFILGYTMCELDSMYLDQNQRDSWGKALLFIPTFIGGLFLGSIPAIGAENSPFYSALVSIKPYSSLPSQFFWQALGAGLAFVAISQLSFLKRFFSTRILLYMGRISFSLYLVHYILVAVAGTWIFNGVWSLFGIDSDIKILVGGALAYVLTLCPIVLVAEVFCRLVDEPSVQFSRTVDRSICEFWKGRSAEDVVLKDEVADGERSGSETLV